MKDFQKYLHKNLELAKIVLYLLYQKTTTMFIKSNLQNAIIELLHISRTALCGNCTVPTRYDKMVYIRDNLNAHYKELVEGIPAKQLWLSIEESIAVIAQ